jgi:N-acetylmuramoyl-L-alanine amidase
VRTVKHIVILSSGTPEDQDIGAREIDRMHRSKGCLKIGYHYVVRRNGMIETGRPEMQAGGFDPRYNATGVGVCVVAPDGENWTPQQDRAVSNLENMLIEMFPRATVITL